MERSLRVQLGARATHESRPLSPWLIGDGSVRNIKQNLILCGCCLLANLLLADELTTNRPSSWAQPIKLEGVANLHQITTNLFRSAQPTAQGMRNLKQMGIRTVVNLRSFNSDQDEIGTTGLGYEHIYMKAWHPEYKEVVRFLKVVTDAKRQPVLLHCQHGADRTGTMCAMYRVVVQGWTKEEAIREMTEGGFGFHEVWKNLPKWIEELDIESIRKEVGMVTRTEPVGPANGTQSIRSDTNRTSSVTGSRR